MKVLIITGSRDWPDNGSVEREIVIEDPDMLYIGDCKTGADFYSLRWILNHQASPPPKKRIYWRQFKADWDLWSAIGRRNWAGPVRNYEMVKAGREKMAAGCQVSMLAFPLAGTGTRNCMGFAEAARIPIRTVTM